MELNESINKLELYSSVTKELKAKHILQVGQLCKMKKRELSKLGLSPEVIEQIEIKLQLQGLDLKR